MRFWNDSEGVTGMRPPTRPKRRSSDSCTDSVRRHGCSRKRERETGEREIHTKRLINYATCREEKLQSIHK